MNNNDRIIAIIKEQMKLKKLSSNELARRVGVAKSAMSRYLNLNREFPLNKVNEFSKALDLSPEYILGFENNHIETHNIPVVSKISGRAYIVPIFKPKSLYYRHSYHI